MQDTEITANPYKQQHLVEMLEGAP